MIKPTGFLCADQFPPHTVHRVFFMDCKGKDISFDRWRFDLYYAPHLAMTHFEPSQEKADIFRAKYQGACFANYEEFAKCQ